MTERAGAPKKLPGWVWGGLIGCMIIMSWMGWNTRGAQKNLIKTFGGEAHLQCVKDAGQVFATRLGPATGIQTPQQLADYAAVAEPIEVPPELSRRFQKILTSSSSYRWDIAVGCVPRYGYRLRFVCDGSAVEAWVCLQCGTVEYVEDGKNVGGGLFLPAKQAIRELSQELFPGDAAIGAEK